MSYVQKYPLLNRWKEENEISNEIKFIGFVTARENKIWQSSSWNMSNSKLSERGQQVENDMNWRKKQDDTPFKVECNTPRFDHSFHVATSYSISNKEYIDVEKVFYYVTLGAIVNKKDMLEVREWVRRSVESFIRSSKKSIELEQVYIRVSRPFDGKDDIYQVTRYMPEHYSAIAKGCINWAASNNTKLLYIPS